MEICASGVSLEVVCVKQEPEWECGADETGAPEGLKEAELEQRVVLLTDHIKLEVEFNKEPTREDEEPIVVKQEPDSGGESPYSDHDEEKFSVQDTGATAADQSRAKSNTGPTSDTDFTPYQCGKCGEKFRTIKLLSEHISTIHNKRSPRNTVAPESKLAKSKKRKKSPTVTPEIQDFTEVKLYICYVIDCRKAFVDKRSLSLHLRHDHEKKKVYSCDFCNKEFNYLFNLNEHRNTHTAEQPYICDICQRPFSHFTHLIKHKRTHSSEKPYSCKICDKSFKRPDYLKAHSRMHTGEKPFQCKICNKRYGRSFSLNKHKKSHVTT